MHVDALLPRVAELAVAAFCLLPACLANDSTDVASFTSPPPPREAGCALIRNTANESGCRIDWSCTDGGALTFVCQPDDGGFVCACIHGEEVQSRPSAGKDVCNSDGGLAASAALCGWMVAP
jgi:hypothetical protein